MAREFKAGKGVRATFKRVKGLTGRNVLRKPLRLPVWLGEDFSVEEAATHTDITTVGAGEFSVPGGGKRGRQLQSLSGETLTMTWDPKWLVEKGLSPKHVEKELRAMLRSRSPVKLIVTLPGARRAEFNGLVTMRALRRSLRHGETDTRYFQFDLREYRELKGGRRRRGGRFDLPLKHKLKASDTLRSVARRYYGKEKHWKFLGRENGLRKWGGSDPIVKAKRFKPGDRLKVPELRERDTDRRARLDSDEDAGLLVGEEE